MLISITMKKSPKQEFIVLILIVIQYHCATDLTTDYAFLLDGNLMSPMIRSETRGLDIIPQLNNFRRKYNILPIEDSREDFFKVHKEPDVGDVANTTQVTHGHDSSTLKIDGIIEKLVKKESEYKLASIIREIQKKLTTVSKTTTKNIQKTTKQMTKKTVKTTKGPKTKLKWNKPKKVPVVTKKRTTTMIATKKFLFKAKEVDPSSDPSRRSCGRMSPNQEKLLGATENDVSDVIFFSPQNAKPIAKPKPKPKPKPQPKRRFITRRKNKNNKGGKQNNKKRTTKKKLTKTTKTTKKVTTKNVTTSATTPEWLNSFRKAQKEGRVIDPKKPVFENDTHVLMLRKIPIDKLDESQMVYPFIVSLHGDINIERVCIGSLIAPTWVLSAAHCLSPPNVVTRVRYGDMSLPPIHSTFSPIVLTVINPSFDESLMINDICLLKVKQIPIYEKVGKLTTMEYKSLMGQPIRYAGFGFTTPNKNILAQDFRKPLQIVEAEVVSCAHSENQLGPMFCISMNHWKKHEMTLLGDAGGPAIHFGMIAGICTGEVYAPIAVYTPLSPYVDWIRYTVLLNEM